MSTLRATICDIRGYDNLHIVQFDLFTQKLTMLSLELDESVRVGSTVELAIKPTQITLAKGQDSTLACSNRLIGQITQITNGSLLSSVQVQISNNPDCTLEAILLKDIFVTMNCQLGDTLALWIKESDISIARVVQDV